MALTDNHQTLIPLFILVIFIQGCGIYSFSGSTIAPHIKTVAVPLFEDQTVEFGTNQKMTDILIEAITDDNTLKVADERSADSILRGIIVRIQDVTGQYDQSEIASDFRINITVKVAFQDLKERKVLWEETWTQFGTYESNREDGIDEALDKLATMIINQTVSGW